MKEKEFKTEKGRWLVSADESPAVLLLQPADHPEIHTLRNMRRLTEEKTDGIPFSLALFEAKDWNRDLSPWAAPGIYGREDFGGRAEETLRFVKEDLIPETAGYLPEANRYIIGGYSLAGLFALWAAYQTDLFEAAAGVSPSVWYPEWDTFISDRSVLASYVYLSLGKKEEKAGNRMMREVGNRIRMQYDTLREQGCRCDLVWHPGGHFQDPEGRTAEGFARCIREIS